MQSLLNGAFKPPKEYRNLRLPREQLICKKFSYSNSSDTSKTITVKAESEYVRVKNPVITMQPHSSEFVHLRVYLPRTAPNYLVMDVSIQEEGVVEEQVRFCVTVI